MQKSGEQFVQPFYFLSSAQLCVTSQAAEISKARMKEQIYEAVLDWGVYYTSFAVTRQNVKREDNTYFDYWSTRKPKSYHR